MGPLTIFWPDMEVWTEEYSFVKLYGTSIIHQLTHDDLENVREVVSRLFHKDRQSGSEGGPTSVFYLPALATDKQWLSVHVAVLLLSSQEPFYLCDMEPAGVVENGGLSPVHTLFYSPHTESKNGDVASVVVSRNRKEIWAVMEFPVCCDCPGANCEALYIGKDFWAQVRSIQDSDAPLTASMVRLALTERYRQMRANNMREWYPHNPDLFYTIPRCICETIDGFCSLFPEHAG